MRNKWCTFPVVLFFVLLPLVGPCQAQTGESTQILGVVEDPSGSVIAGAEVTATHLETGQQRTTITDPSGTYVFPLMAPGNYTVEAQSEGFSTEVRSGLILQLNQKARLNFTLQIGAVTETIEVQANVLLLNTDDATLGNVVEQKRVVDLPLNGRNFANLAGLMPGVIKGISSNTNQYGRQDSAIAVSANGVRENQGQVLYDGVTTAWNINNATFFKASIEAIQEFKVHAATYSAEYGHNAGGQVEIHTRPGGNEIHGALFEFLRNDKVDARNYFLPEPLEKDILQRNQFGFVLSGPIVKNRTFWMVNLELQREKNEIAEQATVISVPNRKGDFSSLSEPLKDPLGTTFENNIIPQSRLEPISQNYLDFHPLPNVTGQRNLAGAELQVNNINQIFARGDHNFSDSDKLFSRVAIYNLNFPTRELNVFAPIQSEINAGNAVISETHIFSPNVINEAKVGFNRNWVLRSGIRTNTDYDPESLGLMGVRSLDPETLQPRTLLPLETGQVPMFVSGFLSMGDAGLIPDFNVSESWQFVDSFTVVRGVHTFKAGVDRRYFRMDRAAANNARGRFQFNSQVTGDAAADFIIGFPSLSQTPDGVFPSQWRQNTWSFYVQDEWKATRNLTINLGLRYDYASSVNERYGLPRTLRFDCPDACLFPADPLSKEIVPLYDAEKDRFWPRIGIAYRPSDNWVLRLGGGVYNNINQINNLTVMGNPNRVLQVTFVADPEEPTALTLGQNPYPFGREQAEPPKRVVAVPPDRVNAYNIQWSAAVQRQLSESTALEVAYVGSQASHLDNSRNFNDAPPGTGALQPRRRYPKWGPIRYLGSDAKSYYHSLQVRAERRFSQGLSFLSSYTWSHNIDQSYGTNEGLPFTSNGAQDQTCFRCERGDSGFDYRHRLATSFLWDIPTPNNWQAVPKAVLANWSFNGIITYQSGFPFTIRQQGNRQGTGSGNQRPNYVSGQSPKLDNPDPSRWFNTDAFEFSVLAFGNVGRTPLRQPGIKTWDIGFFKQIPVREGHTLQLRFEAFNLFNTPQFRAPQAFLGNPAFGQITQTWLDNRQMQAGIKYLF